MAWCAFAGHNKCQVGMSEPRRTRTRCAGTVSGWAILNSTSFIASWVLMTKGTLGSGRSFSYPPTHPLSISRGPPPPLRTRPLACIRLSRRRRFTAWTAQHTCADCSSTRVWQVSRWNLPLVPCPPIRESPQLSGQGAELGLF